MSPAMALLKEMTEPLERRIADLERIVRLYLSAQCDVERESIHAQARATLANPK